jgi:hypothetical protein
MKNLKSLLTGSIAFILLITSFSSCKKDVMDIINKTPQQDANGFTEYIIKAGQHYSDKSSYQKFNGSELKFTVKFNNTAIYNVKELENKVDVNKLYGFADNNKQHHQFSARFGWRYMDGELTLHAYVYNNGVRMEEEITTIQPGKEYDCSIKVNGAQYVFSANGKTKTVVREATTATAAGYKLYPYFGGDEPAPHDVHIWMRDIK